MPPGIKSIELEESCPDPTTAAAETRLKELRAELRAEHIDEEEGDDGDS